MYKLTVVLPGTRSTDTASPATVSAVTRSGVSMLYQMQAPCRPCATTTSLPVTHCGRGRVMVDAENNTRNTHGRRYGFAAVEKDCIPLVHIIIVTSCARTGAGGYIRVTQLRELKM